MLLPLDLLISCEAVHLMLNVFFHLSRKGGLPFYQQELPSLQWWTATNIMELFPPQVIFNVQSLPTIYLGGCYSCMIQKYMQFFKCHVVSETDQLLLIKTCLMIVWAQKSLMRAEFNLGVTTFPYNICILSKWTKCLVLTHGAFSG